MEAAYFAWKAFQERFLKYIAAVLLLGCTLLAMLEVIRRYVFGTSFPWQQDVVTYFILSAVFLFFSISQRRQAHLRVTVILTVLRSRGRLGPMLAHVITAISSLVSLLFVTLFVYWGISAAKATFESGRRVESQMFSIWPFLVILLIGFSFVAITLLFQLYRDIQTLRGKAVMVESAGDEEGTVI